MKQRVAALAQGRAPDDAVERFARSVSTDAPWSDLVDAALAVHRWTNARRQRYDEAYQDRIRVLSEGVRDDGKNPDTYEMLARFLYEHHQVPTVWNGPRGGGEQVRPQSAAEHRYELARALDLTDGALKVNGRHVNSMATKALILVTLGRGGQAAPVVDAGLAIDPKNVRLLRLKSEMEAAAAGSLASRAAGLRMGRTETHRETRADGEYLVTTRYAPSAADLQLAADLEAQAETRQREANRLAGEAKRGGVRGHPRPGAGERGQALDRGYPGRPAPARAGLRIRSRRARADGPPGRSVRAAGRRPATARVRPAG
jgi:hypothetical protein